MKKDYVENHRCKSLKKGNSKPFYKHMKEHKNGKKMFRLTRPDATMATDATECANMLNNLLTSTISPGLPTVVNTKDDHD